MQVELFHDLLIAEPFIPHCIEIFESESSRMSPSEGSVDICKPPVLCSYMQVPVLKTTPDEQLVNFFFN